MLLDDPKRWSCSALVGGGATGFGSFERCSLTARRSWSGLSQVRVVDDIYAGMEVMPRRGSMKPAACAPAGGHNCCAHLRTGPILADRFKRAGRRVCLRLPWSICHAAFDPHGGFF